MNERSSSVLDQRIIDTVLEMGSGYVLDLNDSTYSRFFAEHGVDIDNPRYSADGTSKAKRLRRFLQISQPPATGRVLAALLRHRIAWRPDGIPSATLASFCKLVVRLGGQVDEETTGTNPPESESTLLQRVFKPDLFKRLPVQPDMSSALIDRMAEAQRCIDSQSFLSAVILCGSVLEGMCLGFGSRHPERANRGFAEQYSTKPKQFHEWKLREWIEVLARLRDLSPNVEKFGHGLRDFRNYVHPAEQLLHRFSPDLHTARIAFHVVVAAAEDLVRADASIAKSREAAS